MAAHYIKEVCALQPEGPYFLGGGSFGGNVAFEMAQQLSAQGQTVALVALFDTDPLGYSELIPHTTSSVYRVGSFLHRMKVHWSVIVFGVDRLTYVWKKVRRVWRRINYRVWQITYRVYQSVGRPLPRALQNVQQANYKAARDYRPQVYPGRVTLFCASGEPRGFIHQKQLGWSQIAAAGVDVYEVPGDHITMLEEPYVRSLAQKLQACLNNGIGIHSWHK